MVQEDTMTTPRVYEGVPYYRYVVTYTLTDGRRRRMVRWSPGLPWLQSEVARELQDVDVKPGSNVRITPDGC